MVWSMVTICITRPYTSEHYDCARQPDTDQVTPRAVCHGVTATYCATYQPVTCWCTARVARAAGDTLRDSVTWLFSG